MKVVDFQGITIKLDRPRGFVQDGKGEDGKPWRRVYRYDYGFIPKTEGGDGEDVDVFLGASSDAPMSWWALQVKADGSFDEFKVFLGFSSFDLAKACYRMHIPPRFCAGWAPVPVAMIKSLLGLAPVAVIKALRKAAMKNRTQKIAGVSFEQVTSALGEALRAAFPAEGDGSCAPCPWPTEVYDDRVIYSKDGAFFEQPYTFANGIATLSGSPSPVVRQYVPAGGAGTAQQKSEEAMKKNGSKASVKKAGGGDIVQLAAERLAEVAKELGKGDGLITADVKSRLDAVVALLETAKQLYTGSAAEEEGDEDGEGDELDAELDDMAALAAAEKSGGVVKMSGPRLLEWAVAEIGKVNAEKDDVRKMARAVNLEKALTYASLWAGAAFEGDTAPAFPVSILPETGPAEVSVPAAGGAPAGLGPAAAGGATAIGGTTAPNAGVPGTGTYAAKMADVQKAIAALRGGETPAGKSEAVAKGVPGSTETGLWPASYVDSLPDASFLYVETAAAKNASGLTEPAFRHFPIRDMDGKLSKTQLAHAIKMIPTFGATPDFKTELLSKANGLFGLEASVEKSAASAAERGDDGWPDDLASPDFMNGRQPAKGTKVFGFDDLAGKAKALG